MVFPALAAPVPRIISTAGTTGNNWLSLIFSSTFQNIWGHCVTATFLVSLAADADVNVDRLKLTPAANDKESTVF